MGGPSISQHNIAQTITLWTSQLGLQNTLTTSLHRGKTPQQVFWI